MNSMVMLMCQLCEVNEILYYIICNNKCKDYELYYNIIRGLINKCIDRDCIFEFWDILLDDNNKNRIDELYNNVKEYINDNDDNYINNILYKKDNNVIEGIYIFIYYVYKLILYYKKEKIEEYKKLIDKYINKIDDNKEILSYEIYNFIIDIYKKDKDKK